MAGRSQGSAPQHPDGPHVFTARVEQVQWGRNTYTVLRLPDELVDAASARGTHRVRGDVEGVAVDLGVVRAPVVSAPFVYLSAKFLRSAQLEPGEPAACRLAPADPDVVAVPADLRTALAAADLAAAWEALTPGRQRALIHPVVAARRPATRADRIARLLRELSARV